MVLSGRFTQVVLYIMLLNTSHNTFLKKQKMVFKTNYRLMQVKRIVECSKGTILQYFRPSLGYYLSLRSLFCLFFHGH